MREPRTCGRCGMLVYDWLGEPGEEALIPNLHECPPPLPRDVAEAYVATARARGGLVVSPRMQARIRLGLAEPSE